MRNLLVVVLAACGVVACGSSSSSGSSTSGSTGGSGSTGTTGGGSVTFTIGSNKTWPAAVTVPVNGTLHVVNNDSVPHTVTSEATAGAFTKGAPAGVTAFDTNTINAGASADVTIHGGAAGTQIPVYCAIHTSMMSPANPVITLQ